MDVDIQGGAQVPTLSLFRQKCSSAGAGELGGRKSCSSATPYVRGWLHFGYVMDVTLA